jgi:regulator of nonsense transcripts 1
MEPFENFNDTSSQYGAIDDTASMVSGYTTTNTARTENDPRVDFGSLSLSDGAQDKESDIKLAIADDDFDGVLEDLKDNDAVDLPPHACRYIFSRSFGFKN